ncbi:hypothetical protein NUW58_g4311 [Xylaria curta]|uniref:Uncharacterized protein n=1 Tax=Xylaria curta TaxID=42375 RepID=A0ACC1P723_9PEZI|nr:hypothetical protein NUW58_g4311 [Xylaria curta]
MANSKDDSTYVPLLSEKHSGIPEYLLEKAQHAKAHVLSVTTKIPSTRQRAPVYPPGVEESVFNKAIDDLREQLGSAQVVLNDQPLEDGWYMEHPNTHDMMYVLDEEELVPSAMVYPGSTEEVQQIVRWANKYGIPISPISMGRNFGYGGAAPRVRGSVLIDLGKRMNKILDINPDDYTCLVEPGVSFFALHQEVKKRGYDHMWIDPPDVGGGSVIGNTVDRGVGYTPYGDHWSVHSGLEVVLPTGEVIRTGMGALPGNNTWQTFPYGFGPYSDGIFSQSNYGIVTKMGMALMPNPGGYESFMYTFPKEEDLTQLIEIIRPLRIGNILENAAQLRHVIQSIAVLGKPRSTYYTGDGPIPIEVIREAASKTPLGDHTWVYYGMSYGPPHIRKYKLDIIDAEFKKVPGARRIDPATLSPDEYFWSRDRIASGTPDVHELRWVQWVPNGAHIAFSPISPIRGTDATRLIEMARRRHDEFGIDLLPAFIVGLREMHLVVEIVFDRTDAARRKAALQCLRAMIDDAAACGIWRISHASSADGPDRGNDALDPNGILAPGRCGIWPKKYRGRGWEMTRESGESSQGNGVASDARRIGARGKI